MKNKIEKLTQEQEDIAILEQDLIRHGDVWLEKVSKGRYKFIQSIEYDPFEDIIRALRD